MESFRWWEGKGREEMEGEGMERGGGGSDIDVGRQMGKRGVVEKGPILLLVLGAWA